MTVIDDIINAPPSLTPHEIEDLRSLASALPLADGGTLLLGDNGFATALAFVILAGLEALDAG